MSLSDVSKSRASLTTVGLAMRVAAYLSAHSHVANHLRMRVRGSPKVLGGEQCSAHVSLIRPPHHNIAFQLHITQAAILFPTLAC